MHCKPWQKTVGLGDANSCSTTLNILFNLQMPLFISRCDHPRKHYVNLISIYIMLMMPYSKKVTFSEQNHGLIKSVLMSPVVLTLFFFCFFFWTRQQMLWCRCHGRSSSPSPRQNSELHDLMTWTPSFFKVCVWMSSVCWAIGMIFSCFQRACCHFGQLRSFFKSVMFYEKHGIWYNIFKKY